MKKLFLLSSLYVFIQINAQNVINFNDIRAQIGNTGIHISGTDSKFLYLKSSLIHFYIPVLCGLVAKMH
jgi:hypothetical protein